MTTHHSAATYQLFIVHNNYRERLMHVLTESTVRCMFERNRKNSHRTQCHILVIVTSDNSTGWAKKRGHRLMTIILSILNRFFTGRLLGKFAVKWISAIPPYLAYVATLPYETLMSAKQAINDKLLGSVATYLRCGGVVNNQIKKGLLLSL